MTAPVRIDASAWGDLRFATLARLCGFAEADHALIKVAKIWSWQTEHYTDESPTYVVDVDIVESALGPGGADHLVRARLAEAGPDGLRIRGSRGRIEWLWNNRKASARGGEATRRKHADKGRPTGQPPARPEPMPSAGPNPGPLVPDLAPVQESQNSLAARAIPPSAGYDPESPADRTRLAESTYERVATARDVIAAELGLRVVPMPRKITAAEPAGFRDLRDRIRAEGHIAPQACDAVVETLTRQAREDRDTEWLSDKAFTEGGWRTARNGGPRKRAGPKRAGDLIGPASPRNDHPAGERLLDFKDL